jgi:hypothetical protein
VSGELVTDEHAAGPLPGAGQSARGATKQTKMLYYLRFILEIVLIFVL